MTRLVFAAALAALLLGSRTPLQAQTVAALPQGDGRDLVAVACSQCHALNVVMAGRDGPVGWRNHVYNMVLRGAQLTPREAETALQYLVANFGPGAPAPGSVTLPSAPGKELVETRCAVCHTLERVTAVKRPARDWDTIVSNMYGRWGVSAPEEAQAIAAYLGAQFGRN
jgi:mono/diheme cytochrome c family protein